MTVTKRDLANIVLGMAIGILLVCASLAIGEDLTPACALNPDLCEPLTSDKILGGLAGEIRAIGSSGTIIHSLVRPDAPQTPCGVQDRSLPENAE